MSDDLKGEVIAIYAAYAKAFLANDTAGLEALTQFPIAYVGDAGVSMLDSYPIQPADLMSAKQWHSTKDVDFEVVAVSPTKAHLVLRNAKRVRADGSAIETVSAFYALTRTATGWKFFVLSDIVIPA